MFIRPATALDVAAADSIYKMAKTFMKEGGNPDQWTGDYPSGYDVELGIAEGVSYVCEDEGEVVAVFYFAEGPDPTYLNIYDGEWQSDEPYSVIHRVAVKHHGRGIIDFIFSECFGATGHLRIDTHKDNIPMQRVLARNGFVHCGIIYLENGDERIAFEKIK